MWPTAARPNPADLPEVWALVNMTTGDPARAVRDAVVEVLSLQRRRHARPSRTGPGWATRWSAATRSATKPDFAELVADFATMCHSAAGASSCWAAASDGWICGPTPRCSARRCGPCRSGATWSSTSPTFDMVGRKYRNLRQAVQRTRNAGVTTEVVAEQGLDDRPARRADRGAAGVAERSAHRTRLLDVPRRRAGGALSRASADRRPRQTTAGCRASTATSTAGHGSEVTLDVPWRRRGAPNGIDERLSVDMIGGRKTTGRAAAVAGVRGVPGDLQRQEPGQDLEPDLHARSTSATRSSRSSRCTATCASSMRSATAAT